MVVVVVADGVHFDSRLFLVCGWKAVVFCLFETASLKPARTGPDQSSIDRYIDGSDWLGLTGCGFELPYLFVHDIAVSYLGRYLGTVTMYCIVGILRLLTRIGG